MGENLTETQKRIISAAGAGIKMSELTRRAGVSPYKLTALTRCGSYRVTGFSDDEERAINSVLDEIKAAL